jgi:fatty acid CoA ligase FadD36
MTLAGSTVDPEHLDALVDEVSAHIAGAAAVAVVAQPDPYAVAALLAAMDLGVRAVPISVDAGPRERAHILQDSGAEVIVEEGVTRPLDKQISPAPGDAALVLYTSGTTGLPKAVPISSAAITWCLDALADAWEWTPDDTLVHGLPLHHVHGLVLGLLGSLRVKSRFVHTGSPTPSAYAAARGSLYFGVPTVWSRIVADPGAARALTGARLLVSGSAALSPRTFEGLRELAGQRPIERYGMTETLITISARASGPRLPGAVGTTLPGISTRLVGAEGDAPAGDGASIGELEVHGPTVFAGYVGRPDATRASFTSDGWFRTGDAATIDAAGIHRIVGRLSTDLVKSGGYRIGTAEVEQCLQDHLGVLEAAVIGVADDDLGQRLVAFVVAEGVDEDTLATYVGNELSWHKRPRQVVFVDSLPRNTMGKVEKARLTDLLGPTMA